MDWRTSRVDKEIWLLQLLVSHTCVRAIFLLRPGPGGMGLGHLISMQVQVLVYRHLQPIGDGQWRFVPMMLPGSQFISTR